MEFVEGERWALYFLTAPVRHHMPHIKLNYVFWRVFVSTGEKSTQRNEAALQSYSREISKKKEHLSRWFLPAKPRLLGVCWKWGRRRKEVWCWLCPLSASLWPWKGLSFWDAALLLLGNDMASIWRTLADQVWQFLKFCSMPCLLCQLTSSLQLPLSAVVCVLRADLLVGMSEGSLTDQNVISKHWTWPAEADLARYYLSWNSSFEHHMISEMVPFFIRKPPAEHWPNT